MATSGNLRKDIANLSAKDADLHRELARHQAEVSKQGKEANQRGEAARKTKVESFIKAHLRAMETAAKNEGDALKKVANTKRKIADVHKAKAAKEISLRSAEENERKSERQAREREKQAADRTRDADRPKDLSHARELARVSAPTRYVYLDPPKAETLRVLYLTANPDATETTVVSPDGTVVTNGKWLRTEHEVRNVKKEIRGALHRDAADVSHMPAATFVDMLDGLNGKRPHVVHFSGHGGGRGLLFDNGSASSPEGVDVSYDSLAAFLAATDDPPKLLVLNACDTLEGAEVLLPSVPVVIAMSDSVSDAAAAIFAGRFYATIAGSNRSARRSAKRRQCSE